MIAILNLIFWPVLGIWFVVAGYHDFVDTRRSPTVGHWLLGSLWRRPRKSHLGGGPRSGADTLRGASGR